MKICTAVMAILIGGATLAEAQSQNPAGAFATVPVPGQVQPPAIVAPQPAQPQAPGVARPTGQAQPAQQQEQLRIVADPATNSLIVYGTAQEFQNIKNILKDLDAIPRQVLLDVMVAEVTLSDRQTLGVDYEIAKNFPSSIFGQKFGSAGAIRTLGELFPTNNTFGGGVSGIFGGKDIRAFINALQSDSRFRVLSTPSILATDNKPARIQVGTEEPIATGTISQAVGGIANSTSIQYRNTGRIVTIIPQVNSQGLVNLQILAEVSQKREKNVEVGQDTFPAFDSRIAETTAVVQDGDTLVIGGIITDGKNQTRSGVPYLMDIPVIGRFFRTTTDTNERTELIMMISPRVIRGRDEARNVSEEFKNSLSHLRNELEREARERAKSQPKRPAVEPPPMPDPDSLPPIPQSAPSNVLPERGASVAPSPAHVNAFTNYGPAAGEINLDLLRQRLETQNLSAGDNRSYGQLGRDQIPGSASGGETPAQPLYVLSIAPVPVEPIRRVASQPKTQPTLPKQNRIWAVQVAALAENKLAESVADQLRKTGYEAYVVTFQGEGKIWHRVRIGRFENHRDAIELQKALVANKQFQRAYVALN
jgi:cell division septation protein DedD